MMHTLHFHQEERPDPPPLVNGHARPEASNKIDAARRRARKLAPPAEPTPEPKRTPMELLTIATRDSNLGANMLRKLPFDSDADVYGTLLVINGALRRAAAAVAGLIETEEAVHGRQ